MQLTILTAATGPREVEAVEVAPGLYVHRQPDDVDKGDPRRWRISHGAGYAITAAMRREDALAGAQYLATVTDWTDSVEAIKSRSISRFQLYADLRRLGCSHPESEGLNEAIAAGALGADPAA